MACGTLGTLVLTATLLGHQKLQLEPRSRPVSAPLTCASTPTRLDDGNGVLRLKDRSGKIVYEVKVQVPRFDFYETTQTNVYEGGVTPAKSATLLVHYPITRDTSRAVRAELKTLDGTFLQSTSLPSPATAPGHSILLGLK